MHWGHAVSRDLVNWQHIPIALFPDEHGMIFSGSAVVDRNDTAGFGREALVAVFTYNKDYRENQNLVYSIDMGRTWTKYAGNPIIPAPEPLSDFRDPKVFWHEDHWVMALAAGNKILFFASTNLKDWERAGSFGDGHGSTDGVWETPELFLLGQLTQLTELNLSDNQLTPLPDSLGQLTQLTELDLQSNKLTALPDSLGQLTQLTELYLQSNKLTILPKSLGQVTELKQLQMDCNFFEEMPIVLSELQNLELFAIGYTQHKTDIASFPLWLRSWKKLKVLAIVYTTLESIPVWINELTGSLDKRVR